MTEAKRCEWCGAKLETPKYDVPPTLEAGEYGHFHSNERCKANLRSALSAARTEAEEARRATLEDAAKVCDYMARGIQPIDGDDRRAEFLQGKVDGAATLASRIRALLSAPPFPAAAARWRPEVAAFADAMEAQLRANDHKGGWHDDHHDDLLDRLREETKELADVLDLSGGKAGRFFPSDPQGPTWSAEVLREAADVANFAMMIADNAERLAPKAASAPSPEKTKLTCTRRKGRRR